MLELVKRYATVLVNNKKEVVWMSFAYLSKDVQEVERIYTSPPKIEGAATVRVIERQSNGKWKTIKVRELVQTSAQTG